MKVIVTPDARADANDAALWYRRRAPETVVGFQRRFRDVSRMLRRFPEAGPPYEESRFRYVSLAPYPFTLMYELKYGAVRLLGVLHERQSIRGWIERQKY